MQLGRHSLERLCAATGPAEDERPLQGSQTRQGQGFRGVYHVVMGPHQLVKGTAGFVEKGSAGRELGLLPQKRDTRSGVQANGARVRLVQARDGPSSYGRPSGRVTRTSPVSRSSRMLHRPSWTMP